MVEPPDLIEAAGRWVVERYPYNSRHLLRSLAWLDELAPGSRAAVRLAALTHDMERAFPGPDAVPRAGLADEAYYRAHSERSSRIVGQWLRAQSADERLVCDVEALILLHETGGSPEADLVQAADSLSFLETNVDLFLDMIRSGARTAEDVEAKFTYTYDRIQVPRARELARPLAERARDRLEGLRADLAREKGHGS